MSDAAAASTETPTLRLGGPQCPVHCWPLKDDVCPICEAREARGLEPVAPCPPHESWPREFRSWLFREFMLEKSQGGTDEERIQRSWEAMLHTVAQRRHVLRSWTDAPSRLYDRLRDVFAAQRPAP